MQNSLIFSRTLPNKSTIKFEDSTLTIKWIIGILLLINNGKSQIIFDKQMMDKEVKWKKKDVIL